MRLILTILLIGLFKADAQIVINASAPYRPMVSANLFLDQYTGASGAYSLRKLRTAYTGAAVRVRKDTTDQPEQEIGFTANGDLDTAALKQFLNARSGFIVTWMDQSTNGRNATQATQANQPRIANLGVIERIAGDPSIFFDGTNDDLAADAVGADFSGEDKPLTSVSVINKTNTNTRGDINVVSRTTTATPLINIYLNNNTQYGFTTRDDANTLINRGGGTYAANTSYLYFTNTTGTSVSLYSNNVTLLNASAYNNGQTTLNQFRIGSARSTTNYYGGYISETIIYPTDRGGDRSGMQTNINSYYGIY
jgi:hypothetical protein